MSRPSRLLLPMVGAAVIGFLLPAPPPPPPPPPAPDCILAVNDAGEGDWYCGTKVHIPRGLHVEAPTMPACTSDDGSGPVPCRRDAGARGNRTGRSFTVLRDARGLLIRFDDGVTIQGPDQDCWDDASCAATRKDPHPAETN